MFPMCLSVVAKNKPLNLVLLSNVPLQRATAINQSNKPQAKNYSNENIPIIPALPDEYNTQTLPGEVFRFLTCGIH